MLSLLMNACENRITVSNPDPGNLSFRKIFYLPEDNMRIEGEKVDADAS